MRYAPKKNLDENSKDRFHKWVQTSGIILAGAWGIYTFAFKEIISPKSAPVNITVDLKLNKVHEMNLGARDTGLECVMVNATAINPSTRTVSLLTDLWVANGYRIEKSDVKRYAIFSTNKVLSRDSFSEFDKCCYRSSYELIGYGNLFQDQWLKPNEKIVTSFLLYFQKNKFDYIEISSTIPTANNSEGIELNWRKAGDSLVPEMFETIGGEKKLIEPNENQYNGGKREYQSANSTTVLSLWE